MKGLVKPIVVNVDFYNKLEVIGKCRDFLVFKHSEIEGLFYAGSFELDYCSYRFPQAQGLRSFKNWQLFKMSRIVEFLQEPALSYR
jgi:hypothetical protein